MEKKIAKKYADLIVQANNSTGRKEALSLIKQATKLKNKLDQYEICLLYTSPSPRDRG